MRDTASPRWRFLLFPLLLFLTLPRSAQAQHCDESPGAAAPAGGWTAPLNTPITIHLHDVSLRDALDRITVLAGVSVAYSADVIPVDRRVCINGDHEPLGSILAAALRGARIQILVVANRIVLSPGAVVTSPADESARGVNVLERVVVTGNAVPTSRRPLAIGLEVIDGEQLRRQAISSLADLLDSAVPGVWSWPQSPSTLIGQYGGIRGASSFGSSAPKIYVDGVEVANPLVVTQLNPDAVERVEVIRGPQGSALYGSDAISGVINILTRHDGGTVASPLFSLRSTAGATGSAYATGLVPTHEQRLNMRLGSNVKSAGLAATFGQTGALYPSSETRQLAATGDGRLVLSGATLTATARVFDKSAGLGRNPILAALLPVATTTSGSGSGSGGSGSGGSGSGGSGSGGSGSTLTPSVAASDTKQSVRQYTLSTNAAFATEGIWTHNLVVGVDGYSLNNVADAMTPIPSAVDSALRAARGNGDRYTIRGSSVARLGTEGETEGTLTFGLEQSVLRQTSTVTTSVMATQGQKYATAVDGLVETWNHDTGLLSQLNMSWDNNVFLTGGLRVERNDAFSGSNRYPLLPMVGLAAVRGLGDAEIKWRVAYGKGIRPPQTPARQTASGYTGGLNNYSLGSVIPALDPEVQAGYETGAELYVGRALTVQLTRFDQRATGLIQNVAIGVDTFSRGSEIERRVRYQLQNVGEISNTGWELQGNLALGQFALASALSSVDSRVQALARGYAGDLRPGDRMLAVPARTASGTVSWLGDQWFASLGATRAFDWINYDRYSLAKAFVSSSGIVQRSLTGSNLRGFWMTYNGDTHLRLTTSRNVTSTLSLLLVGDNLLGGQLGEPDNITIRQGRTITGGLRASF